MFFLLFCNSQILQFIFAVQTFKCIGRKTRELHPCNLLNGMEENPAAEPDQEQYSLENQQIDHQTYNPQTDDGYYQHVGYDGGDNDDQYNNPEFYQQDNSQMHNTPAVLQHQPSYSDSYDDQAYTQHQNYQQTYNPDDYWSQISFLM